MPQIENVTQSGISCYITRNWAKIKSILDKELPKDSIVCGNFKQTYCKSKSGQELELRMVTFQNEAFQGAR
jgi:hypothetical protein